MHTKHFVLLYRRTFSPPGLTKTKIVFLFRGVYMHAQHALVSVTQGKLGARTVVRSRICSIRGTRSRFGRILGRKSVQKGMLVLSGGGLGSCKVVHVGEGWMRYLCMSLVNGTAVAAVQCRWGGEW